MQSSGTEIHLNADESILAEGLKRAQESVRKFIDHRDKVIYRLRQEGHTLAAIGKAFDLSVEQVRSRCQLVEFKKQRDANQA